jgi:hypothetical protein
MPPIALERKLKRKAAKKFPKDKERQDAYVFGTLRKTGWVPSTQKMSHKTAQGVRSRPRRKR